MKAVMLEVPEHLLAERARLGVDRWDELWEGVLHMVPPPCGSHQRVGTKLLLALGRAAERRGLEPRYDTGLFAADDDYRIPDLMVCRPEQASERGVDGTAELVIEILSPGDESRAKLPWYAARLVGEIVLIDPVTRQAELYDGRSGRPVPVSTSAGSATVELASVGAVLTTVEGADGTRLRVDVAGERTEI